MKEFTINYQGNEGVVQIEDAASVKAHVVMKCLRNAEKRKGGQNQATEYDAHEWLVGIATNCISKAPWGTTTPDIINNMSWPAYEKLSEIVSDEYPMGRFLLPGLKLLYGDNLPALLSALQTGSTTSSPSGESPKEK